MWVCLMEADAVIDLNKFDEMARKLADLVPPSVRESGEELQANMKSVLQTGFSRLDLVTREEFDVQRGVLLKTREKLEALEAQVAALELAARERDPES